MVTGKRREGQRKQKDTHTSRCAETNWRKTVRTGEKSVTREKQSDGQRDD